MICISPIPRFLPELTGKRMAKKKKKTPNKQTKKQTKTSKRQHI